MKQSLKAFMNRIIDYAGLFPPAKLSLDTALSNYLRYRSEKDAWMLSRFIIPAARLEELTAYKGVMPTERDPLDLSVLGGKTETVTEFEEEIDAIVEECRQSHEQFKGRVKTGILEVRLPEEAVQANDVPLLEDLLLKTVEKADSFSGHQGSRYIFYEAWFRESWKKDLQTVLEAVSRHNRSVNGELNTYHHYAGFKLRCGGEEAHMIPSPEQVAYVLNTAREFDVAVKCTAGLHHPVRHYSNSVNSKMHGFFNVFGGAMLAFAHDLSDEELIKILMEEDPEQFTFSDEAFSWHDMSIAVAEIKELRETTLISYGSCSFDEPREDLQKLKLL